MWCEHPLEGRLSHFALCQLTGPDQSAWLPWPVVWSQGVEVPGGEELLEDRFVSHGGNVAQIGLVARHLRQDTPHYFSRSCFW